MKQTAQILGTTTASPRLRSVYPTRRAGAVGAALALGLAFSLTLGGCGLKGPLYLPAPAASSATPPHSTASAPTAP
ncbi:LPS translocon maturation chaperone LptM [Aquabacterium sp.]|uniref:LPS translocon maturation chaperone LptM n=1 Tax=Aquabacterium sp. TaxID=1872578 RepID=UPI0039C86FFA